MTDLGRELRDAARRATCVVATPDRRQAGTVRQTGRRSSCSSSPTASSSNRSSSRDTPVADLLPLDAGRLRDEVRVLPHRRRWASIRNLTAGEIVGQVRVLLRELGMLGQRFNIVLMGMGEPLHNYDATMKALRILGRRARPGGVAAARHALDRRRAAGARTARDRAVDAEPRDLAALDDRGSARPARADQPQVRARRNCWTPAGASRSSAAIASRSST